ncbi:MAG: sulfatase-like hydrolase/transferase [Rhodospirillales bacterium]|nr:sulfatase-like hydrolase/transferase [Rhodospirillales bacterium]
MSGKTKGAEARSRREFMALTAGVAALPLAGLGPVHEARAQSGAPPATPAIGRAASAPNIVFVFTDQERHFPKWPTGLSLPGHERLMRSGTTFTSHYCPATMCTSSRSVLISGLQTPDNGMFENLDVPWMRDLPVKNPTVGHMLRKAGYYTVYKGKWHLSRAFHTEKIENLLTAEMEKYGFADCFSPGDVIGHTLGGYSFDHLTTASAINWLRTKGRPMADEGKPWCMYMSLVNPHDIMYFNTDRPDQRVQDNGRLLSHAARAPAHQLYAATWDLPVAPTLKEPLDAPGRPGAHREFDRIWDHVLGNIPLEEERWRRFNDYYVNCIRAVDQQIADLQRELDALNLSQRTIIVFTSDHGEMAGAHGLRGKGPFAYEEELHLPMHIVHPDVAGGQTCASLTSHIDLVPTILSMAGLKPERAAEVAGRKLPGKDLAPLLSRPGAQGKHAAREAALFTYSGLGTNDAGAFEFALKAMAAGKNAMEEAKRTGFKPDLKKRGTVRSAFDGRYRFTRYFAPVERNRPTTIDELFRHNDVELFDHQTDPGETRNLALDRAANAGAIMAMNAKLEAVIKDEIGVDDGREMPDIPNITWGIGKIDL